MSALVSLLGMVVFLGIAYLLSENRKAINLRTVGGAFLIQLGLGAFVLYTPIGIEVLDGLSTGVQSVIDCGNQGTAFIFGGLVSPKMFEVFGGGGFVFAFKVLAPIIFFSSLIAVLYHLGIMQWIIRIFGGGLRKVLGTSRTESMSASANIFVGQTEAPLVVKPYIPSMTGSELFAVMCGGLSSIAGAVLAGYAGLGVDIKYLLAACFMAAPGGLLFAKLIKPETEVPNERLINMSDDEDRPVNVFDAAASGASSGLKLAANVGAMLLAFVSLIALLNLLVGGVGGWFGLETLTVQQILGYVFSPLAWVLGIPWSEAMQGGSFIGQKIILNEFVAYQEFATIKDSLTLRTQGIITFALCGFANLSSIAILLGGLGVMAPSRRSEIARYGLKAVAAASLANFMSAAIAGFFLSFTIS
ncbi:NupC/NupG family nucleoside CNT transporter [bacterium]|nr:NupC/NupG family nucleoside CNT transporter [bacterium]